MERIKKSILAIVVFLVLVTVITLGQHYLWIHAQHPAGAMEDIYQTLAVSLIVSWIIFIVAFYIWAIQFYNVNKGWTDEAWKRYLEERELNPLLSSQTGPENNTHQGETMGLPAGTVRATLALSILVTGMALAIASLSMNKTYPGNELFTDNFEFVKTGFLMMLAFYFGTKSLETLRKTNMKAGTLAMQGDNDSESAPVPAVKQDASPEPVPVVKAEAGTLHDPEAKG